MFECVTRQRGQRFEFPHGLEPATDMWAKLLLPALGGKDELRAPEHQHIDQPHGRIPARLEIANDAIELANRIRWRKISMLQPRLNLVEPGSRELSAIDEEKHSRQHVQPAGCIF